MKITNIKLDPKQHIFGLLGNLCKEPNLLIDSDVHLNTDDFVSNFHKVVFFAVNNLIADNGTIKEITEFDIDTYLKTSDKYYKIWTGNDGINYIQSAKELSNIELFNENYHTIKKYSILRKYDEEGIDISDVFDVNTTDPDTMEKQQKALYELTETKLIEHFTKKILDIREELNSSVDNGVKYFKVGDGLDELKERINQAPEFGYPFRNPFFNTLFNGKRKGKFFLQSGASGFGKTRQALMEMLYIACDEMVSSETGKWEKLQESRPCLFISTELEKEELQLQMLSFITKIMPNIISAGHYTKTIEHQIDKAIEVMSKAPLYIIEMEEFDTSDIRNEIERYILNYNVEYINFDYIQMNPKLSKTMQERFGHTLRDDQTLLEVSRVLKNISKEYNVFISSSTQLGPAYSDPNPEISRTSNALRGSKAIADKVDYGVIIAPPTKQDMKKINNIECDVAPNMSYWVYKNRNSAKNIVIWSHLDLGTMKEQFLFVTDYQYHPVDITLTNITVQSDGTFTIPDEIEV